VEAAAEAFDVVFVEVALAAEDFGDNAGSAEDIGGVFLQEAVLVHEELEDFERLGAGKLVVAVFEILDQKGQEIGKLLFGRGKLATAAVQFVEKLGASLVFLLSANHAGREFLEKLDVFGAGRKSGHSAPAQSDIVIVNGCRMKAGLKPGVYTNLWPAYGALSR
jgi:hypothetical protein